MLSMKCKICRRSCWQWQNLTILKQIVNWLRFSLLASPWISSGQISLPKLSIITPRSNYQSGLFNTDEFCFRWTFLWNSFIVQFKVQQELAVLDNQYNVNIQYVYAVVAVWAWDDIKKGELKEMSGILWNKVEIYKSIE